MAFKMSEVSAHEKGAVTKHTSTSSMRREIEELSACRIKELFDYCGSRGIERLRAAFCCFNGSKCASPTHRYDWPRLIRNQLLLKA